MKIIPVSCSFDNYSYVVICEETNHAAIVDPTEAYPVLSECDRNGAELKTILCTHHHNDHIGEIPEIISEYKKVKVYCHVSDAKRITTANHYVSHGDSIRIGNLQAEVLHTPGHTLGSICYKFDGSLITGDTLFGAGCGRLFEGTPKQMMTSLQLLQERCTDSTQIYFGHEYTRKNLEFALEVEPENIQSQKRLEDLQKEGTISIPSTMGLEKATNPFLRASEVALQQQLERRGSKDTGSQLAVFTQLRLLRNEY
jgi:hydroxyacylglutathione hydrolase